MTPFLWVKYLHFLGIFLVVAGLTTEFIVIKQQLLRRDMRLLSKMDNLYGIGTLIVLAAGFTMWFSVGKSPDYYSGNWIFLSKLGLFTVIGLLSIWPTIYFAKNKKGDEEEMIQVPKGILWMIRFEMVLFLVLPLLATMMANGLGSLGG